MPKNPLQTASRAEPVRAAAAAPKSDAEAADDAPSDRGSGRRQAKRRPAGPARGHVAANDDIPTIGGLIYALQQKPSRKAFTGAAIASVVWSLLGVLLAWSMLGPELEKLASPIEILMRPAFITVLATVLLPIAGFWGIATLIWRAQELRLMSSAMTEVAVRLAEPDRTAEQSVASLGQAVRKQVGHMNDAVSIALGRAGELEALVHNEVALLERSYSENERRIRGLLTELQSERAALETTSGSVSKTLRSVGEDIPELIEKLSSQQIKLARIIEGAGQNLISLETSLVTASTGLETTLGTRTTHLQSVLDEYATAINSSLGTRTTQLQSVFEEYTRALDTTLASRAQALDTQLVERTKALDDAFSDRLALFDESIIRSTLSIDGSLGEKARALTAAMESHTQNLADTLNRQSANMDESLMHGINAVRRTSENITRQSVKAIEGLSGQADMLKNVSENLLQQINGVTGRFENQGQAIMRAANALEGANYRIDSTLANRHHELNETLSRLSGKTDDLDRIMQGYSSTLEGSMTEAEMRARTLTDQLAAGAHQRSQAALADLERLSSETDQRTSRALEDLRGQFGNVSREVDAHLGGLTSRLNQTQEQLRGQFGSVNREVDAQLGGLTSRLSQTQENLRGQFGTVNREVDAQLGSLTSRFGQTSDELRSAAARAATDFEAEQERIRAEAARLPAATRESSDAMRRVLNEQLAALEQLSSLSAREVQNRDIAPPAPQAGTRPYAPAPAQLPMLANAGHRQAPPQGYAAPDSSRAPWSVGDLLARASHTDPAPGGGNGGALNIESIARALDPTTASAIWARVRGGQKGFMVRSIYPAEMRATFDEVSGRYRLNAEFRVTVDRFMADFENLITETGARDASGQVVNSHLVSDSGRVYLFLAHAAGRIS